MNDIISKFAPQAGYMPACLALFSYYYEALIGDARVKLVVSDEKFGKLLTLFGDVFDEMRSSKPLLKLLSG